MLNISLLFKVVFTLLTYSVIMLLFLKQKCSPYVHVAILWFKCYKELQSFYINKAITWSLHAGETELRVSPSFMKNQKKKNPGSSVHYIAEQKIKQKSRVHSFRKHNNKVSLCYHLKINDTTNKYLVINGEK